MSLIPNVKKNIPFKTPNIHTFGQVIPCNPDNLPEAGLVTGPGTERPVGFTLARMSKLYWTVKNFKVSIAAVPLLDFTFEAFLLGGGSTGTILGSLGGLATASLTQPIPIFFQGETGFNHVVSKKVRNSNDGVCKGLTPEQFLGSTEKVALSIDKAVQPNYTVSELFISDPGLLVAPGGYYRLFNNYGAIFINFSDIIYAQRQYWPKILIFLQNPVGGAVFRSALVIRDPLFSGVLESLPDRQAFQYTTSVLSTPNIGGVIFDGGLIKMFGLGDINTYAIFGSIFVENYSTTLEVDGDSL
jgi:hypothetical protein